MSRVPQPDKAGSVNVSAPIPADYGDEVSEKHEAELKSLVKDDKLEEWETVSGPAW